MRAHFLLKRFSTRAINWLPFQFKLVLCSSGKTSAPATRSPAPLSPQCHLIELERVRAKGKTHLDAQLSGFTQSGLHEGILGPSRKQLIDTATEILTFSMERLEREGLQCRVGREVYQAVDVSVCCLHRACSNLGINGRGPATNEAK